MEMQEIPNSLIQFLDELKKSGISEIDYQKHIGDFFEFSSRNKGIPLHGTFELTPLCNLNCKMCYVHLNSEQFDKAQLLPLSTWKYFIDEAYECGMRKASLTGGECLTHPLFDDIYLYLHNKGVRINVLTNGILLDESRVEFFKKHCPKSIQVTVYGSSNEAYEKVTGIRAFDVVEKNVLLAKNAGLKIKIAITPSRFMLGDFEAVLETVDRLGVPYSVNAFLTTPRKNTGRENEDVSVEDYIKIYKKRNELRHYDDEPFTIDPAELPEPSSSSVCHQGLRCGAGRSAFLIKHDGTMAPCLSLHDITSYPLVVGFRQAWREINNIANSYLRPAECDDCYYYSVCLKCVSLHKNAPEKGHCDPRICDRTKKMIAAGVLPLPGKL